MNWNRALLLFSLALYAIAYFASPSLFNSAVNGFVSLLWKITPSLLFIAVLMVLFNKYASKKFIGEWLNVGGARGWLAATIGGLISMGPVYLWYPLIADLREKGFSSSLSACFLYNRAVKLPLLPLMATYFGLAYTLILGTWMIVFSIINGLIVGRLVK